MIVKLNLPAPSQAIIALAHKIALEAPLELQLKEMHDKMQDYTVNSVSRKYVEDEELELLSQNEFRSCFEEEFISSIGVIKNIHGTEKYAFWPPHADRTRIFALNYYVQEGGEHVTTIMYNAFGDMKAGIGTGRLFKYGELEKATEYHLDTNSWYALSVRQAHSIENIETTRIIYTLSFLDTSYPEFIQKYPQYLMEMKG